MTKRDVEVQDTHGNVIGFISVCSHGSKFIQKKIVPRGNCVNYGTHHSCDEKEKK